MLNHYPGCPVNKQDVIENEGYQEIPERLSFPLKYLKDKKVTELCDFVEDYEICSQEYINLAYQNANQNSNPNIFSNIKKHTKFRKSLQQKILLFIRYFRSITLRNYMAR